MPESPAASPPHRSEPAAGLLFTLFVSFAVFGGGLLWLDAICFPRPRWPVVPVAGTLSPPAPPVTPLRLPGEPVTRNVLLAAEQSQLAALHFRRHCAGCHGEAGRGDGVAAYLLFPKPRDLTRPDFRLVSSPDRRPTVEDVFHALSFGMPGSAMPSWEMLTEDQRWQLAAWVLSLQKTPPPMQTLAIGPEPPVTRDLLERAQPSYYRWCAMCHGPTGHGNGGYVLQDGLGYKSRPRNFTQGIFKGSRDSRQLYRRIALGLPGTAMTPHAGLLSDHEIWDLVHFVQSLSAPEMEERRRLVARTFRAERAPAPPADRPGDPLWERVPAVHAALMPLWWREQAPDGVEVRALRDGEHLLIRLSWADATYDHAQTGTHLFSDGAAVQLCAAETPPFLGMGAQGVPDLRLWYWKADRQQSLRQPQDVQTQNPDMYVATYCDGPRPGAGREALAEDYWGIRDAKDQRLDDLCPFALGGRTAGNIVSTVTKQPGESLSAHGMATVGSRPGVDEDGEAWGEWNRGRYAVVFRRRLSQARPVGLSLIPERAYYVAFAVWDGSRGDRDGQKSVTIWHRLVLAP